MATIDPNPDRRSSAPGYPAPGYPAPGQYPEGAEVSVLRHYAAVLRRRWMWVVVGVLAGVVGGYLSSLFIAPPKNDGHYYKATTALIVNMPSISGSSDGGSGSTSTSSSPMTPAQLAYLAGSQQVLDPVAAQIGGSADDLRLRLTAVARSDVNGIDITGIGSDPASAVRLADTVGNALIDYAQKDAQQRFNASRDTVLKRLDDLKAQRRDIEAKIASDPANAEMSRAELDSVVNQYRLTYEQFQQLAAAGTTSGAVSTLQSAVPVEISARAYNNRVQTALNARGNANPSMGPSSTALETDLSVKEPISRSTRVMVGGAAGLVLGVAAAFLLEAWDDRLRRRERVEAVTALPVLAEIPALPKEQARATTVAAVDLPRSRAAEQFRSVRTALLFALNEHLGAPTDRAAGAPVVLVTSPGPAEGKTTTVANTAGVLGLSGIKTLVIDCDYHKPTIAKYLAPVPNLERPGEPCATRVDNVDFVPAPKAHGEPPSEVVARVRRTIDAWRAHYDMILLDTPPMLTTNDASDLLNAADTVMLVVRAGRTRAVAAERVAELLRRFRADALGVVYNAADETSGSYYYYGYGYGYYPEGDDKRAGTAAGAAAAGAGGRGNGMAGAPSGPAAARREATDTAT